MTWADNSNSTGDNPNGDSRITDAYYGNIQLFEIDLLVGDASDLVNDAILGPLTISWWRLSTPRTTPTPTPTRRSTPWRRTRSGRSTRRSTHCGPDHRVQPRRRLCPRLLHHRRDRRRRRGRGHGGSRAIHGEQRRAAHRPGHHGADAGGVLVRSPASGRQTTKTFFIEAGGGTFTHHGLGGETTAALGFGATAQQIKSALEALAAVDTVTVTQVVN